MDEEFIEFNKKKHNEYVKMQENAQLENSSYTELVENLENEMYWLEDLLENHKSYKELLHGFLVLKNRIESIEKKITK